MAHEITHVKYNIDKHTGNFKTIIDQPFHKEVRKVIKGEEVIVRAEIPQIKHEEEILITLEEAQALANNKAKELGLNFSLLQNDMPDRFEFELSKREVGDK